MAHFDLKVGYLCNNNCIHCVVADQRKKTREILKKEANRSYHEILSLLSSYKKKGFTSVTITGGEPTIRNDFFEILDFAKNYFFIGLQTNGRAFNYDWFSLKFSKIIKSNNISIVIALHGHNKEIHDKITRTKNSFKQTTQGLKNLINYGYSNSVTIKIVLSKFNANYILLLFKFIHNLGLNNIALAHPHGNGNALKYFYDVIPKYSEYENELNRALAFAKEKKMNVKLEAIPYCFLNPEFRVLENDYYPVNSILYQLDMPKPSDWYEIRKTIRKKTSNCKKCIYFEQCEGVWDDYAQGYGLDELNPILDK